MKLDALWCSTTASFLAASLAALALLCLASPALDQSTYDFESLSFEESDLIGQDGWVSTVGSNPGLFVQQGVHILLDQHGANHQDAGVSPA